MQASQASHMNTSTVGKLSVYSSMDVENSTFNNTAADRAKEIEA